MNLRFKTALVFIILSVFGGLALLAGRLTYSYLLSQRFHNDRFLNEMMNNFSNSELLCWFVAQNIGSACLISILPSLYFYTTQKLPFAFALSYSCAIFFVSVIGIAFYLNMARVTMPMESVAFYVVVLPLICIFLPIWFAYAVLRIYWLAKPQHSF